MSGADARSRVWGIIPAAGAGRRMERFKQALPYRHTTMAGTVARTMLEAGVAGLVVVTRTELADSLDLPADPRVRLAFNDDAETEMIDSIRIGLSKLGGSSRGSAGSGAGGDPDNALDGAPDGARMSAPFATDGILIVPADMPLTSAASCALCISAFEEDPKRIVIAVHDGRRGHPMIFPWSMRSVVEQLEGGLNQLSKHSPQRLRLIETGDAGVTRDIDTKADYEGLSAESGAELEPPGED